MSVWKSKSILAEFSLKKKSTYARVIGELKSGSTIATGNASAKALGFLKALGEHGSHLKELTLQLTNTFEGEYPIAAREGVRILTGFYGPLERKLGKERGTVSSTLLSLGEKPRDAIYQFASGAPDQNKFEDYSPLLRDILSRGLREVRTKANV